jgi:hypothetical protein
MDIDGELFVEIPLEQIDGFPQVEGIEGLGRSAVGQGHAQTSEALANDLGQLSLAFGANRQNDFNPMLGQGQGEGRSGKATDGQFSGDHPVDAGMAGFWAARFGGMRTSRGRSLDLGITTGAVGAGAVEVVEAGWVEAGWVNRRGLNAWESRICSGCLGLGGADRSPITGLRILSRTPRPDELTKLVMAPSDELPNALQLQGQAGMRLLHRTGLMTFPTAGLYQSSGGRRSLPE